MQHRKLETQSSPARGAVVLPLALSVVLAILLPSLARPNAAATGQLVSKVPATLTTHWPAHLPAIVPAMAAAPEAVPETTPPESLDRPAGPPARTRQVAGAVAEHMTGWLARVFTLLSRHPA